VAAGDRLYFSVADHEELPHGLMGEFSTDVLAAIFQ
jgi:hypothetical protein